MEERERRGVVLVSVEQEEEEERGEENGYADIII